ncbi:hypothetical protein E2R55_02500 [Vibrio vulnificus]|nr:hypothetical protein E2R55_02500 [Vibrio vulnificus]
MKIHVVYDSEGEHTKALAYSIAEGAQEGYGAEVHIDHVDQADVYKLSEMDAILWGCPGHFGTISSGLKAWIDIQCFQDSTQEDLNIKRLAMKDEEYRNALKTMKRKRENEKNRKV